VLFFFSDQKADSDYNRVSKQRQYLQIRSCLRLPGNRAERGLLLGNMRYTNRHILEFLEDWAPQSTKLEYDNVGLLVGSEDREVSRILACLDVTPEVVEEAVSMKADLIVAHHPLIFRKLSRITPSDTTGSLLYRLIKNDISVVAAHTNLDAAPEGVSFVLAECLGLMDVTFLKAEGPPPAAGNADSSGDGRERDDRQTGFGAIGRLPDALGVPDFLELVAERLGSRGIRYSGDPALVSKVAVCGGSGSFLAEEARLQGADAYVTADLKYHEFFTGSECVPACGCRTL
jgi:dinuclear metal center YbgI/SA1388 family protein